MDIGQILLTTSDLFFYLMTILILGRVLLSWLPQYRYSQIGQFIYTVTDPVMRPIQNLIPPLGMIDISPIIASVALQVLQVIVSTIITSIFPM